MKSRRLLAPPTTPTDESDFQRRVVRDAEALRWWTFHDNDPRRNKAGFLDLLCIHESWGLLFYAELKIPPRKPTPAQLAMIKRLRAAGQRVYLWTPDDQPEIDRVLTGRA